MALVVGTFPYLRHWRSEFLPQIQSGWGAFSRWAALSVGLVAVTGLYAVGQQTASLDAVIATLYGWALSGKVVLVLATGAVGLFNFTLLHPQVTLRLRRWLRKGDDWRLFRLEHLSNLVLLETGLGILVLLLTGLLTAAPPAHGPEFAPAPKQRIDSMTHTVDDLVVSFSAKPNLPGTNVFTIRAASQRRPPPAEVLRLILRFTYLEEDMGTVSADAQLIGPDLYQLGGNYFDRPGKWQVDVVVRRGGLEDSVAQYDWFVPVPAGRPVVISNQPWEPWLTGAAVILLLLVLTLALSIRSRQLPASTVEN
jgi:copper transport protein